MTKIAEAYSRLVSLKAHIPQTQVVNDTYINEYNEIVSLLAQASGADLSGFGLNKLLQPIPHSNYSTPNKVTWTYLIDRNALLMKVDALLTFFQVATPASDPKAASANRIGFHLPK